MCLYLVLVFRYRYSLFKKTVSTSTPPYPPFSLPFKDSHTGGRLKMALMDKFEESGRVGWLVGWLAVWLRF